jgi:hypothetical protein
LRTRAAWLARSGAGLPAALRCLDEAEAYARPRGLARLLQALAQDRRLLMANPTCESTPGGNALR